MELPDLQIPQGSDLMRRVILLGVVLLSASVVRGDSQYWYWAWRPYDLQVEDGEDQRGDLIAFSPDGTTSVLLSEVYPVVLRRAD